MLLLIVFCVLIGHNICFYLVFLDIIIMLWPLLSWTFALRMSYTTIWSIYRRIYAEAALAIRLTLWERKYDIIDARCKYCDQIVECVVLMCTYNFFSLRSSERDYDVRQPRVVRRESERDNVVCMCVSVREAVCVCACVSSVCASGVVLRPTSKCHFTREVALLEVALREVGTSASHRR